jgi:hypothetical protein
MKRVCFFVLIIAGLFSCSHKPISRLDLAGEWKFRMDTNDQGISEKWYTTALPENVKLPGSMVENGKGFDVGPDTKWTGGIMNPNWMKDPNYAPYLDSTKFRFPFWLQPLKKYTGAAWYQKKINIPESWSGTEVFLTLERCHWESSVWVGEKYAGMQNSLGTPHRYNLTPFLKHGEQLLTIRIDNRIKDIDPGENSHSISDHTQTNWNGIVGQIFIESRPGIYFSDIQLFPDIKSRIVAVRMVIQNESGKPRNIKIGIKAKHKGGSVASDIPDLKKDMVIEKGESIVKLSFEMGNKVKFWDEFDPVLYNFSFTLKSDEGTDFRNLITGIREIRADGTRFTINHRPVFIRGTLECSIFPKTGFPPTDKEEWARIMKVIKSHGLNQMRFHSWCPPEAAFEAADEAGVYFQVECSSWANQSTTLGDGKPIDKYIWDESKQIVKEYGNHPSFIMMAYGNEPGGKNYSVFLKEFVTYWKESDQRRMHTSGAGWPAIAENDYHNIPRPRLQGWGEGVNSLINSKPPRTDFDWADRLPGDGKPVVSHEIGQWCVYPNFREIEKYTGNLKARNFEIFRESLNANGMVQLADSFLLASGKLQALCYKAEIEAAFRTPGFAGFNLLDLHDFPGQGTALVGVLDPFWEEKGYISPDEFSRFCNSTVPLVRLPRRVYQEGDTITAIAETAHFGPFELTGTNPFWSIKDATGKQITGGNFPKIDIKIDNCIRLGNINYQIPVLNQPRKIILEVGVDNFSNSWDLWVFPKYEESNQGDVKVVEKLDPSTLGFLRKGGKVILSLGRGKVNPEMGGKVGVGFSSIFWNTAWTRNQKPHTLGILCSPTHPALELFPTEYYSNWQWWDAMSHADAIMLKEFPAELKPIVRIIDDWVTNRSLALLLEGKVGSGKIIVSGCDLVNDLSNRPEAVQLRTSLLNYMNGAKFDPQVSIEAPLLMNMTRID